MRKTNKRKAKRSNRIVQTTEAKDWVIIAGLPMEVSRATVTYLKQHQSLEKATYLSLNSSSNNDYKPLFSEASIKTLHKRMLEQLYIRGDSKNPPCPTPRYIFLLYVPSCDADLLLSKFEYFCLPIKLTKETNKFDRQILNDNFGNSTEISWRHYNNAAKITAHDTLQLIRSEVKKYSRMIASTATSPLVLPPMNYHYPSGADLIDEIYRNIFTGNVGLDELSGLTPRHFNRDEVSRKVHRRNIFQDCRDRIFPNDNHAPSRLPNPPGKYAGGSLNDSDFIERFKGLQAYLRQVYRFGVRARDGNVHFDVQFPQAGLKRESMYCSDDECFVEVTGTHANVGINDAIWVPDGTKTPS